MIQVLPSILSADFTNLERELASIKEAGIEKVHIDVMDGAFVPSISLGFPVISSMRKVSDLFFDVHLMVNEPERYIEDAVKSGADCIGIHAEACTHLCRTIQQIKRFNKQVCVVLNPATPLSVLLCIGSNRCGTFNDCKSWLRRTDIYSSYDKKNT